MIIFFHLLINIFSETAILTQADGRRPGTICDAGIISVDVCFGFMVLAV